jgi:hypothetical protein
MNATSLSPATHEKKINLKKTEAVEWELEIDFSETKVPATFTYTDEYDGWLSRAPVAYSAHPELAGMKLQKIKGSRQPGGIIKVTLSYECTDPEAVYPGRAKGKIKRYHMEPGGGEEPLLTNKLFKDLPDAEKEAGLQLVSSAMSSADFTTATAALTSEAGIKLIEKVRKGYQGYRAFGVVWVERFTTKTLADVELTKIYKTVSTPPGGCPEAGNDYDWLRLPPGVNPHDDGESWDIENRWELSLFGKWDPDFYPAGG